MKSYRILTIAVIAVFLVILKNNSFAQITGINYQAVAVDDAGKEIAGVDIQGNVIHNKAISVRFSILQESATGTILYQETHTTNTDQHGLFTLVIGQGVSTSGGTVNSILDIDWSTQNHYLKVEIDFKQSGGYKLMGVQQLLAVPYAYYALKSGDAKQTLTLNGNELTISGSNTVTLPNNAYTAGDGINITGNTITNSAPNQLQVLSIKHDTIFLTNGGFVKLPPAGSNISYTDLLNTPTNLSQFINNVGFITAESDPTFAASPSKGITTTLIDNWNIAYGWGNHAGLYRPISYVPSWSDISGKPTLFDGTWASLTGKPTLFDGTWSSLTGKPTTISGYGIADAFDGNYNNLTNKPSLFSGSYTDLSNKPSLFSGNFIDLASKPTTLIGYGITDAINTSHAANGITSTDITNWTTAYNWGNHAAQGYLKTYTETDPIWSAASANYYTKTNLQTSGTAQLHFANLTNKPTTLGGYGITDAMNTSHASNGITSTDITNWTTAYNWGNHAAQGYLKTYTETDPVWTTVSANYYTKTNMQTSGSSQLHFGNITNRPTTLAGYGITDAMSTSSAASSITSTDITNWTSAYNWGNHATQGYLKTYTETDPVFGAWNKSTGISITASQVSDFQTTVTNNAAVLANTAKNSYPSADATKLTGIAEGAEVNVNADWNASSGDAQILNKPTTLAGYGITDAVSATSIQNGSLIYNGATGSSNAYVVDITPAITTYTAGMTVNFKANFDNTGASTININGLGAKAIKKSVSSDLEANDIKNGQMVSVIYDGANFQVLSLVGTISNVSTARGRAEYTILGDYTFTTPPNVYSIDLIIKSGGGGRSGNGCSGACGTGGNGGSGGYVFAKIFVNPNTDYSIRVGGKGITNCTTTYAPTCSGVSGVQGTDGGESFFKLASASDYLVRIMGGTAGTPGGNAWSNYCGYPIPTNGSNGSNGSIYTNPTNTYIYSSIIGGGGAGGSGCTDGGAGYVSILW